MEQLVGKGLSYWEIIKFLSYTGVAVVSMVLPLTILLSSIMAFGDLGERYELAAMKAAGISLTRVMTPLFFVSCCLAIILFLFSNNIVPDFQKKAKNMLFNIAQTKPALNFTPGQFIDQLPGYLVKFDKVEGVNQEKIEGVFIHKKAYSHQDNQTIIAQRGKFVPKKGSKYLKLELYNGFILEDASAGKSMQVRDKQPDQPIKFDTLVNYFDISELIEKALEKENITDDYRFQTYGQMVETIDKTKKANKIFFDSKSFEVLGQASPMLQTIANEKKAPISKQKNKEFKNLTKEEKKNVIVNASQKLDMLKTTVADKEKEMKQVIKSYTKIVLYQQKIIAFSFTCIIFFLIGSSLGSIIRKGGLGVPVIIAIVFFIIFFVMTLAIDNIVWTGVLNPYFGAWLPNLILLPIGVWMTYKALTDSQLFDAEKYKAIFKPITKRFAKSKEHKRYQ